MEDLEKHEPVRISCPFEPYDNPELATMAAIDFLMSQNTNDNDAKSRIAQWVNSKYYYGEDYSS